jgi:hypothetical protein
MHRGGITFFAWGKSRFFTQRSKGLNAKKQRSKENIFFASLPFSFFA